MQPSTCRGVLPLLAALVVALAPVTGMAQPTDTSANISREPLFTGRDAWVAGGFVVTTLAMHQFDKSFARRLQTPGAQEQRFVRHQATNLRIVGEPGTLIIGTSMWAIGRLARVERMADLGLHGTEAVILGLGLVAGGKMIAGRARPYRDVENPNNWAFMRGLKEDPYRSFPSGHTAMGFAAASAVTAETSKWWPKSTWFIAPVMYGGATLIGASRMYNNKHWASDVAMGAAIGTFSGLKIVHYHHSHPGNRVDRWLLGGGLMQTPDGGTAVGLRISPRVVEFPRRPSREE